jgi:hypothetical protein
VNQTVPGPNITESQFEHRHVFAEPWVDKWIIPNPFIAPILATLHTSGVELTDFSFNKDAANVAETYLNVAIRRLNAAVRIGLDAVTYVAVNADWGMAPQLFDVFGHISELTREIVGRQPVFQEATLAFHVMPGTADFRTSTASLVNPNLVSGAEFYGISIHRNDGILTIDKSVRYDGAAFVRLQRRFTGEATFTDVASRVYQEEIAALRLLGISV